MKEKFYAILMTDILGILEYFLSYSLVLLIQSFFLVDTICAKNLSDN